MALTKKGQEQISPEVLLEAKLELLHRCLDPKEVPKKLPEVLSEFDDAFDMFRQTIEATLTMDEYTEALSTFRDILLKDQ